MLAWLRELDDLLRGRKSTAEALCEGTRHIRLEPLLWTAIVLGLVYGAFMGLFAVVNHESSTKWLQLLSTMLKVPALFFLTLLVTFPSLYVFSALLGVRLGPVDTLRLIVAALAVNLAVLASLGPITGFFTVSTTSYQFMKFLNVFFFATAGTIGLGFLLNALRRLEAAQCEPVAKPAQVVSQEDGGEGEAAAPELMPWPPTPRQMKARAVFRVWLVIYAIVGAQMGWILRPFIGDPELPFVVFRGRTSSFFEHLWTMIFGG